jgi:hypothetical protein
VENNNDLLPTDTVSFFPKAKDQNVNRCDITTVESQCSNEDDKISRIARSSVVSDLGSRRQSVVADEYIKSDSSRREGVIGATRSTKEVSIANSDPGIIGVVHITDGSIDNSMVSKSSGRHITAAVDELWDINTDFVIESLERLCDTAAIARFNECSAVIGGEKSEGVIHLDVISEDLVFHTVPSIPRDTTIQEQRVLHQQVQL